MKFQYFFTITAGRTGTAWMAEFLAQNLGIPAIHEPLAIEDFGVRMPDIRIMRTFNDRGYTSEVRRFHTEKLDRIAQFPAYAETNHTLAKCGLLETLRTHDLAAKTCLIILKRDPLAQCISYLKRGDFLNITLEWQWYLSQNYKNNIVSFRPLERFGLIGKVIWYVFEIDARQKYYQKLYKDDLSFISADLEDIITPDGARRFLEEISIQKDPILPQKKNASPESFDVELNERLRRILGQINYDSDLLVDKFISQSRSLGQLRPMPSIV